MTGTEFDILHSARLQQQGTSMTGGHNASLRVQRTPGSTRTRSNMGSRQWVKINAAGEISYVEARPCQLLMSFARSHFSGLK